MGIISILTQPEEVGSCITSTVHTRTLKLRNDITWPAQTAGQWPHWYLNQVSLASPALAHVRTLPSWAGVALGHSIGTALWDGCPGCPWEVWEGLAGLGFCRGFGWLPLSDSQAGASAYFHELPLSHILWAEASAEVPALSSPPPPHRWPEP